MRNKLLPLIIMGIVGISAITTINVQAKQVNNYNIIIDGRAYTNNCIDLDLNGKTIQLHTNSKEELANVLAKYNLKLEDNKIDVNQLKADLDRQGYEVKVYSKYAHKKLLLCQDNIVECNVESVTVKKNMVMITLLSTSGLVCLYVIIRKVLD